MASSKSKAASTAEQDQPTTMDKLVDDPDLSTEDERQGAPGFVSEDQLSTNAVIQRRTSTIDGGPQWPADGRYHKVFTVATPRLSTGKAPELDWNDDQHRAMHEANKVAVLQEAINRGLHPKAEARFEGQLEATLAEEAAASASLEYSVEVVPATEDGEEAASTYTPSAALVDQGGTTLPE